VATEVAERTEQRVQEIPVERIDVHKLNPRVDIGEIDGLAASIQEQGVLQPILVVRDNGGWALVDGKRRLAAAIAIGVKTIRAIEREMTEDEIATAALVANLQRKDLDPLEEAQGYKNWLATTKKTQAELARAIGKDPSTISNALRVLDAPKLLRDALREKRITPAHARVALELKDLGQAAKLKLERPMTVDELQGEVDDLNEQYELTGPGAVEAAIKALVDAQARHANGVVTWRAGGGRGVVDLVKALGKPSAEIAGRIGEYETVRHPEHEKACACRAWELRPMVAYNVGKQTLKFEDQRVCIDAKGYAAAKPKPAKTPKAKKVKPLSDAQLATQAKREKAAEEKREREQRTRDEKEIASALAVRKAHKPAAAAAYTKLLKASIPINVARAIVYDQVLSPDTGGMNLGGEVNGPAWARILKLPAKKISELAGSLLADRLEQAFIPSYGGRQLDDGDRAAAAYFGVKVAEPTKAKKKGKR
jgi:ParB family chromosome partitioning protein